LLRVRFPPPSLRIFRKGFSFLEDCSNGCSKAPGAIRRAGAFFFGRGREEQPDELPALVALELELGFLATIEGELLLRTSFRSHATKSFD
jgi:hypothetical protein